MGSDPISLRAFGLALAFLLCGQAQAADDAPPPCATNVDVKAPEWRTRCDAAIAAESDAKLRAVLLFGRAYSAVEQYRYDDGLNDINAALAADPDNANYLRERAYVHGELSDFAAAIADLDRLLELDPKNSGGYRERAYARRYNGDLQGSYADRVRVVELLPDALDDLIARGSAALWINKFDAAVADVTLAQKRAKVAHDEENEKWAAAVLADIKLLRKTSSGANVAARCELKDEANKANSPNLIGDCTRAFFEASTDSARADALTTRASGWLIVASSQTNSTDDMKVALGLDPTNAKRHINLGYSYIQSSHSWAAKREFEKALAIERGWMALAGRAAARANLGDAEGAFADAKASIEIEPNEPAIWVLADLEFDRGMRDGARDLYLMLYQRGSRSDHLMERLKELGVTDPAHAASK